MPARRAGVPSHRAARVESNHALAKALEGDTIQKLAGDKAGDAQALSDWLEKAEADAGKLPAALTDRLSVGTIYEGFASAVGRCRLEPRSRSDREW